MTSTLLRLNSSNVEYDYHHEYVIKISSILQSNSDKLPEDVKNELLIKLVENKDVAGSVAEAVAYAVTEKYIWLKIKMGRYLTVGKCTEFVI